MLSRKNIEPTTRRTPRQMLHLSVVTGHVRPLMATIYLIRSNSGMIMHQVTRHSQTSSMNFLVGSVYYSGLPGHQT